MHSSRKIVLICLLALACVEFWFRGPARVLLYGDFNDLSVPYVGSRLWLAGQNPYNESAFMGSWVAAGGERFVHKGSHTTTRPAYPPFTLVALAPLAALRWALARDLFCLISMLLLPGLIWAVLKLGNIPLDSWAGVAVCVFVIALAPIHTAVGGENIAIIAIELAIIGAAVQRPIMGGLLAAVAFCLKPQLGAWFFLFYVVRRDWRRIGSGAVLVAAFSVLALLRMPHGWFESYKDNLQAFVSIGSVNDFTSANPSRFELINLQVLTFDVLNDYALANLAAWLITGALVIFWLKLARRDSLAVLGLITIIGLMPAYQRIYNAGVVALVFAWAVKHWADIRGKLVAIGCGIFLVPGAAILQRARDLHYIGQGIWESRTLSILIGDHVPVFLLLSTIAMMAYVWKQPDVTGAGAHRDC